MAARSGAWNVTKVEGAPSLERCAKWNKYGRPCLSINDSTKMLGRWSLLIRFTIGSRLASTLSVTGSNVSPKPFKSQVFALYKCLYLIHIQ